MKSINKEELHNIFKEIANKNENTFETFYEKYKNLIYAISFSILKNKEDCEDMVQTIFIKIWNMAVESLPTRNEATWLYTLTKNETLNFLRKHKNTTSIEDLYSIKDEKCDIEEIIEKDTYNKILSSLNNEEQEIVSLKILSNLSFREISQILNIPIGTVQWKYYKSLHSLKILISNLSMFILTITLFISRKIKKVSKKEIEQDENTIINNVTNNETQKEPTKSDNDTESIEIENDRTESIEIENDRTESIKIESNNGEKLTFTDIGMLSISSIFFIITIIFLIIHIKHQQKHKKNVSK